MGFEEVIHTHKYGNVELGKDIIGKLPHRIDGEEWYAFVVKLGKIQGSTSLIENIKYQIKQSFEYPFFDVNGEKIKINKVIVITNEDFSQGAQESLKLSPELNLYRNYTFWWNEKIIAFVNRFYPEFWYDEVELFLKDRRIGNYLFHELKHHLQALLNTNWNIEHLYFKKDASEERVKKSFKYLSDIVYALNLTLDTFELAIYPRSPKGSQEINLEEILEETISVLSDRAKYDRNIGFEIIGTSQEIILGDKRGITIVIYELLKNAIVYSNRQGKNIAIRKSIENKDGQNWIVIQISNWGIGILNQDRKTIFKLFHRGENANIATAGSMGMGLYVVEKIMHAHDGFITLDSLADPTVFSLWFPMISK